MDDVSEFPFNARVGTQTIGPRYHFTEESSLVESARGILEMGSDILKIHLDPRSYDLPATPGLSLTELARLPDFDTVLRLPFAFYQIWIHPKYGSALGGMDFDVDEAIEAKLYRDVYELATYLLKTFGGTGKTFLLGHWEGDWMLLEGYDFMKMGSERNVEGMVRQYEIRQRAVEDARRDVEHAGVRLGHYAEVNRALDAKDRGMTRLVNTVLPRVAVDLVSYSAYEALWPDRLTEALDYIEGQARFTEYFDGVFRRKVFVGEYDAYRDYHVSGYFTPEQQVENTRTVIASALAWGSPFVLFWEFYNNESERLKQGGGFWLVDAQGVKQPVYGLHREVLAKQHLLRRWYALWLQREPAHAELDALAGAVTTLAPSALLLRALDAAGFRAACSDEAFVERLGALLGVPTAAWGERLASGSTRSALLQEALEPAAWAARIDADGLSERLLAERNLVWSEEEAAAALLG